MTDEELLNREVKEIVEEHLKGMVNDIEWKLLVSVSNYADIICKTYSETLFNCFRPLINMKLKLKSSEIEEQKE